MDVDKYISFILGIPKTLYVNFKYFKFNEAIKLPLFISHRVWLKKVKGQIKIDAYIYRGMIQIGFGEVGIFDKHKSRSIFESDGMITFKGKASFGHGSKIVVHGELIIGDNLCVSAESSIICFERISLGDNCLISWDNLIMDTDFHKIKKFNGTITNKDREIVIGNNVWMGCRSTVLKGSIIGNNIVIAASSNIFNKIDGDNQVIGGNPAKVLKTDIIWI